VAEHETRRAWADEYLDAVRTLEQARLLSETDTYVAAESVDLWATMPGPEQTRLAHGDFDVSHIYQCDGRYTGVIDFGEIRGADRLYDLGHFHLHDGETLPRFVLPDLLAGYREVAPLPPAAEQQIDLLALFIGIDALARNLRHPPSAYRAWLSARVRQLLVSLA
jgi:Ser/Thr protein kinase RdoA (MazF antagonist)